MSSDSFSLRDRFWPLLRFGFVILMEQFSRTIIYQAKAKESVITSGIAYRDVEYCTFKAQKICNIRLRRSRSITDYL